MSDGVERFPFERARRSAAGARAQATSFESDLDPHNPFQDSLRAMLIARRDLIAQLGVGDGAVTEIERQISNRVAALAGDLAREEGIHDL